MSETGTSKCVCFLSPNFDYTVPQTWRLTLALHNIFAQVLKCATSFAAAHLQNPPIFFPASCSLAQGFVFYFITSLPRRRLIGSSGAQYVYVRKEDVSVGLFFCFPSSSIVIHPESATSMERDVRDHFPRLLPSASTATGL